LEGESVKLVETLLITVVIITALWAGWNINSVYLYLYGHDFYWIGLSK